MLSWFSQNGFSSFNHYLFCDNLILPVFVITRCLFYFQVATQVAVLISKIARMELREWPELLPTLLKVSLYMYACRQSKSVTLLIVKAFTVLYFLI